MNKFSLQFKSRECEGAFSESQIGDEKLLSSIGLIANFLQFIVFLIYLFFNLSSDSSISYILNMAALSASFFVLACTSQWLKILLKSRSRLLNAVRLFKNIIACIIIGVIDRCTRGMSNSSSDSNSSDQGGIISTDSFQPLLGLMLGIEMIVNLQSTNFVLKIISIIFNLAFYVIFHLDIHSCQLKLTFMCINKQITKTITFWGRHSIGISISFAIGIIYFLMREYLEDKMRRTLFLDSQRSTELSFLIDKLLPINIVVMKYNPKEERSFLHQVNRKAQHSFNITDNDSFKAFSKKIIIKSDSNDPDNNSEIDPNDYQMNVDNNIIEASPFPQLYPSMQAPSMMNLNQSENNNSQQARMIRPRLQFQKTLFFYIESIAKDTFDRQKKEVTQEKKTTENVKRPTIQIDSKNARRNKKDSMMIVDKQLKSSDDKINSMMMPGFAKDYENDFKEKEFPSNEKVNSYVDSPKKESYMMSFDRRSKKDSNSDRQKINSSDNRPKGFSVEKTALAIGDRTSMNSAEREKQQQRKNSTANNNPNSEPNERPQRRRGLDNNGQTISSGLGGIARRTHTVKLETPSLLGTTNARQSGLSIGAPPRRNGRKTTVLRKMPNFNLNPGTAGVTKKYGEDVYDRIDVLTGEYTDEGGRLRQISIKIYTYNVNEQYQVILFEDETLESQVKFLKEYNKFLYSSFTEGLEEFRLPLAYSLLKLNAVYEEQQRQMRGSLTQAPQQQLQQTIVSRQPSMILQQSEASLTNISPASRKNIYPQTIQPTFSNQISTASNQFALPNLWTNLEEEESLSSSSLHLINPILGESVHKDEIRRANSASLDKISNAVDNSRYYGFLTLNQIYNYIDYISLL